MTRTRSDATNRLFDELRRLGLPRGRYAVFGSGPMGIRGLREIHDVDVITEPTLFAELAEKHGAVQHEPGMRKIQIGNVELLDGWYPKVGEVEDLIAGAEIIEGLPFVRLEKVLEWKEAYKRPKDEQDIELLRDELLRLRLRWLGTREYLELLERLVTDPATSGATLYVSAGEADITTSWLLRLFDGAGNGTPRIGRVVLLRLDDDLISRLDQRGELEPGFRQRLRQNVDRLGSFLRRAAVAFEVRINLTLPPFHGYQYGDVLLRGRWVVDRDGRYAARTLLEHLSRAREPEAFAEAQATFDSAPILEGPRPITVGLLVPLKEEWEQLKTVFPIEKYDLAGPKDHDFYYLLSSGIQGVRLVASFLGEMGTTPASQRANRLIDAFQPQLVVIAGIAGSLDGDVAIGDVVTATELDDVDSTSKAVAGLAGFEIQRSGKRLATDYALAQAVVHFSEQARDIHRSWQEAVQKDRIELGLPTEAAAPRDHAGHVASGNVVAAATAYKDELRRRDRKFLAVEMEAAGVASAAWERQFPVKWLSVRGVSDSGDEHKKDLDKTNGGAYRQLAMRSAARYLRALLGWEEFQRRIAAPE